MRIAVIGTGHVGLVTAACLAYLGHDVVGMDDDQQKVEMLTRGGTPFFEPALAGLVRAAQQAGRLSFTTDLEEAIRARDIAFICVGTPSDGKGGLDLSAVEAVARRVAGVHPDDLLLVEKSTVTAQTGSRIERAFAIYGGGGSRRVEVASNPEFLREGSAIHDFLRPDRIVVGVRSTWAEERLRLLYARILEGDVSCPEHEGCRTSGHVPFMVTNVETAELIKHASNAFLATKISFINAVADICDRIGADVGMVAEGMGLDPRIGRAFLHAGIGYGGSCFPKDVAAFARFSEEIGVEFGLLAEVTRTNRRRIDIVVEKLRRTLWIVRGKRIGLLGLAFKPHTDDLREAPALALGARLLQEGAEVVGVDPHAGRAAGVALPGLLVVDDPYAAAAEADALVLATDWPDFLGLDWDRLKRTMRRPVVVDGRNALDRERLLAQGFEYIGMGR
jgi:UDPglucose 6-dehydrogenase